MLDNFISRVGGVDTGRITAGAFDRTMTATRMGVAGARTAPTLDRVADVLLLAFVVTEAKVKAPLLPLRVVTDRNRGGAYLSLGIAIIAIYCLR